MTLKPSNSNREGHLTVKHENYTLDGFDINYSGVMILSVCIVSWKLIFSLGLKVIKCLFQLVFLFRMLFIMFITFSSHKVLVNAQRLCEIYLWITLLRVIGQFNEEKKHILIEFLLFMYVCSSHNVTEH